MNGGELLAALRERYASARSYSDEGVRVTVFRGKPRWRVRFATAFERPDRYRSLCVVERAGQAPQDVDIDSLLKISKAPNAASSAAQPIARLLHPEVGGLSLADLRVADVREETRAGRSCSVITGEHKFEKMSATLWVDSEFSLTRTVIASDAFEATTDYQPKFDRAVDWAVQRILPPH